MSGSRRLVRVMNWMRSSLWFGFAAASIHLLDIGFVRYVRHELTWTGREFRWMAPLSYLAVYLLVGSLGGVLSFFWASAGRPRVALGVFTTMLGFGALFLLLPTIHPLASAVLAVGIGIQIAGRLPHDVLHVPLLLRFAMLPATGVALLGGVEQVTREWREERAIGALKPEPRAQNVILVVLDAVRADNVSAYGYRDPTTPTLEKLADDGVLFERAFSTAPWTLPSHAGMFTGLLPGELYADWKVPFRRKVPTLAEQLRDHGWATGMFSANSSYVTWESGLARGFQHVDDYALTRQELARSNVFDQLLRGSAARLRGTPWMFDVHERRSAAQMVDRFLQWQSRIGARPFFAFINLFDAHEQPLVDDSVVGRWAGSSRSQDAARYDAAIAQMDREIGRMVDSLVRRRVLDRSLLIVTSDHGQLLGEHQLMYHANSVYRRVLQVPLVLRFPGRIPAGQRVEKVVSLRNLDATILDLLSIANDSSKHGSLVSLWSTATSYDWGRDAVAVAQVSQLVRPSIGPNHEGPVDAIIGERWYLIDGPGKNRELYDYTSDTTESTNLAMDPAYRDTVAELSRDLRRIVPHRAPLGLEQVGAPR
jgi:arylsulfatase A-like enzyme